MLILVGVTVNVALQGGLFGKAENATTGTTKHADKEQLISAMVGGVQTGGKFVMTDVTLPDGAKWITSKENVTAIASPSENGNWVMTESGNKFYIDKYGNVLDDESNITAQEGTTIKVGDILNFKSNLQIIEPMADIMLVEFSVTEDFEVRYRNL